MAVPVIALYYVVLTVLSLVLLKNYDQLSLPESLNNIAGYLTSEKEELKASYTDFYKLANEAISQKKVETYLLFQKISNYYLLENAYVVKATKFAEPYVEKVKTVATPMYNKVIEFSTPIYQVIVPCFERAQNATKPYLDKAYEAAKPLVEQLHKLGMPYYEKSIAASKPLVEKSIEFGSDSYNLFSRKLSHYYNKYLLLYVDKLVEEYSPFFSDLYDIYESKLIPVIEEHKDTLALIAGIIFFVVVVPKFVAPVLGLFVRDVHDLNKGIQYRYANEEVSKSFGGPEFETMNDESGGLNDGIAEQEASLVATSSSSPASCRNSGQQISSGSNRTPPTDEQQSGNQVGHGQYQDQGQATITTTTANNNGSQNSEEGESHQQSQSGEEADKEGLRTVIIGSEEYEVTSDILSSLDPKSIRLLGKDLDPKLQKNSIEQASYESSTLSPSSSSFLDEYTNESNSFDGDIPQAPQTPPARRNSSSDIDSLSEPTGIDSVPLLVRAESINRVLGSPMRLAQTAASNASIKSNPTMLGLLAPNLYGLSGSPIPAVTTVSEATIFAADNKSLDNVASSVQYLNEISTGRISPRGLSSGSDDDDINRKSGFIHV